MDGLKKGERKAISQVKKKKQQTACALFKAPKKKEYVKDNSSRRWLMLTQIYSAQHEIIAGRFPHFRVIDGRSSKNRLSHWGVAFQQNFLAAKNEEEFIAFDS